MRETKGIRLVTLIFIIALIVGASIGAYIFIQKRNDDEAKNENISNNTISTEDLNITNDTIQKNNQYILSSDTKNEQQSSSKFSSEIIRQSLNKYLELKELKFANQRYFLESLNLVDTFKIEEETITSNQHIYVRTNIKYSDYKSKMLNYVSEQLFENEFIEYLTERSDILYYENTGASQRGVFVQGIQQSTDDTYIGIVKFTNDGKELESSQAIQDIEYKFTVKNYKGKCVINTCKEVKAE